MALLTASSGWAVAASTTVLWHADLATARRASEISRRPVLVIFTASWSLASTTLDRTTLASDEAVALITACFEPVCLDVDTHAETVRRLGITRVPTACVLTADEQVRSKFELPETPAVFVAKAARAAQDAALATATPQPSPAVTTAADQLARRPAFGSAGESPGGRSTNPVATKVRMLSAFASEDAPASSAAATIAASFREPAAQTTFTPPAQPTAAPLITIAAATPPASASALVSHAPDPFTALTPDAIPASRPETDAVPGPLTNMLTAALPDSPSDAPPGPHTPDGSLERTVSQTPLSIEPAPTQSAATPARSTSWLGLQLPQPTAPTPTVAAATPDAQSTADVAPTTAPTTAQTPKETSGTTVADAQPKKPATSATGSLLAALQKPFSLFSKPTAASKTADAGKTADTGSTADTKKSPGVTTTTPSPAMPVTSATPATEATAATTVTEPDSFGSMPVGLEGYCPVTLTERGAWVEGRAQWGVRHRGRTYLFAGIEQQKVFLADPDRYAPALSGDDPVLAFDAGKSKPGQRRYGVTYQSRMYLFSSTDTRDAFAANPQRYTANALVAEHRQPAGGTVIR